MWTETRRENKQELAELLAESVADQPAAAGNFRQ